MNGLDLTKSQKRIARQVIEIGLVREFETGIGNIDRIIQQWKGEKLETKETYYQIYDSLKKFDKHIARRYDGMTGSGYLFIMAGQLADKAITIDDLNVFDPDVRNRIISISRINED